MILSMIFSNEFVIFIFKYRNNVSSSEGYGKTSNQVINLSRSPDQIGTRSSFGDYNKSNSSFVVKNYSK